LEHLHHEQEFRVLVALVDGPAKDGQKNQVHQKHDGYKLSAQLRLTTSI
jgi:hypothetical protein